MLSAARIISCAIVGDALRRARSRTRSDLWTKLYPAHSKPPITIDIGPITVCKQICGWVDIWGIHVDVDCYVEGKGRK